jgi:hypothetical protein
MTRTKVSTDQFTLEVNKVTHVPTGAHFTTYPGQTEIAHANWGNVGNVLPNGEDYWKEDVISVAQELLKRRA